MLAFVDAHGTPRTPLSRSVYRPPSPANDQIAIEWRAPESVDEPRLVPQNKRGRPSQLRIYPEKETSLRRRHRDSNRKEFAAELALVEALRPRTRGECAPTRALLVAHLPPNDPLRVHAPCPFISCRYHLHVNVHDHDAGGKVGVIEFENEEHLSIEHTCVLDICDAYPDGVRREEMPDVLGVSEERTRAFEQRLREKLIERSDVKDAAETINVGSQPTTSGLAWFGEVREHKPRTKRRYVDWADPKALERLGVPPALNNEGDALDDAISLEGYEASEESD